MKTVWFILFYFALLSLNILAAVEIGREGMLHNMLLPASLAYVLLFFFHIMVYFLKRFQGNKKPRKLMHIQSIGSVTAKHIMNILASNRS
jgi:hypothetical protein